MPSALSYPGVYVEEIASGVRTITGVATSIAAFIGRARKGPVDTAVDITSYADFERKFGELWLASTMSFAVRDFFINGGSHAVIVRLFHSAQADAIGAVANAGAAGATGKDAKDKAAAALKVITDDANATQAQKAAAQQANAAFAGLADGADANAVAA
ncbi:phage tail sheath family protein, partial [Rugamonas sp. FT81W]|nr:phage tail sheath family protein [Duganella vulcania]